MEHLKEILNQYNISERLPITFIRESSDNIVYSIGKKSKTILRISKRVSLDDVKFEYETMNTLSRSGMPIPKLIETKDTRFYASTPHIPIAVLFEYIDGIHAERTIEKMPTPEQAYEAGRFLGMLHKTGQELSVTTKRSRNIYSELRRVIEHQDIFNDSYYEGGVSFVNEVKEAITFAETYSEPQGLIHNDYRIGNVFFDKHNPKKICGIIDFDWSCIGPLFKDVALAVMEWSFCDGAGAPDNTIFKAFLEGYNSKTSHPIKNDGILKKWIWFSGLSDTATWLCDNIDTPNFTKKISRSYMYRKAQFFKSLIN